MEGYRGVGRDAAERGDPAGDRAGADSRLRLTAGARRISPRGRRRRAVAPGRAGGDEEESGEGEGFHRQPLEQREPFDQAQAAPRCSDASTDVTTSPPRARHR